MENLHIAATASTPEVDFRFDRHSLTLKGESYPENASAFYGSVLSKVNVYLAGCSQADITLNIALAYFNSSSTKILFSMLEAFSRAAQAGNKVTLNWYHDEDDETLSEFGQEICEDFPAITFVDIPVQTN
ncbi:MAG: DUF1987 domain-containing protein [Burkholderiales bacterium]|nr:DUF1987 domain-containing protein [Burkholderiales bacterium]